jgi:hypothetical protein
MRSVPSVRLPSCFFSKTSQHVPMKFCARDRRLHIFTYSMSPLLLHGCRTRYETLRIDGVREKFAWDNITTQELGRDGGLGRVT